MYFNKRQKIATIVYAIGIIVILVALTPWSEYQGSSVRYGTFFIQEENFIHYKALYIEVGTLTLFYLLTLILLMSPKINQ